MRLLTPLGLLGLVSIIVLILIYIIRPNFQQKFVSTTFVWKLSLKYKKKRIPTSKLRNILIILCQIIALICLSVILTQPNKILKTKLNKAEVVVILDSSASMRTSNGSKTRYELAMSDLKSLASEVLDNKGMLSVIMATDDPYFLIQKADYTAKDSVMKEINDISSLENCGYGTSDIDAAINLCDDVILENPSARMFIYTDVTYDFIPEKISLINYSNKTEEGTNVAILNAEAELDDNNYYVVKVELASYGSSELVDLKLYVEGPNAEDKSEVYDKTPYTLVAPNIQCEDGIKQTVYFYNANGTMAALYEKMAEDDETVHVIKLEDYFDGNNLPIKFYSYQTIEITLDVDDSYTEDNSFYIYGGLKDVVKIAYSSSLPNNFFNVAMLVLQNSYKDSYDIQITEIRPSSTAEYVGYDFYIFEHLMPDALPTDGVCFLVNPDKAPQGSDIEIKGDFAYDSQGFNEMVALQNDAPEHPILKDLTVENIEISRFMKLATWSEDYEVLMSESAEENPVLLVRNTPSERTVILNFSLHYSNFAILKEFPLMMYNVFGYFFPATVEKNAFNVNEKITLNARGSNLQLKAGSGDVVSFETYPTNYTLNLPGTYTLSQTVFGSDEVVTEQIYVKVPESESNIYATADTLRDPYPEEGFEDLLEDLLLYIASVLVVVLFLEWFLHGREGL